MRSRVFATQINLKGGAAHDAVSRTVSTTDRKAIDAFVAKNKVRYEPGRLEDLIEGALKSRGLEYYNVKGHISNTSKRTKKFVIKKISDESIPRKGKRKNLHSFIELMELVNEIRKAKKQAPIRY